MQRINLRKLRQNSIHCTHFFVDLCIILNYHTLDSTKFPISRIAMLVLHVFLKRPVSCFRPL